MKKLFALLMALTMTVQLVMPAWADVMEDEPEEPTEVVEEVGETTEETEIPETTEEATEAVETTEEVTEEVTEETAEETAEAEPTEETEEGLPEDEVVEDVAALAAGVVASGSCGKNLSWVLTEDGVLRISGNVAMPDYTTSSVAPWYSKRTKITSVVVEPGVTSIGDFAFYGCSSLTSVSIPESVTYIGWYAFYGCSSLTSVSIPAGVTSIGSGAFSGCSGLTSVSIPEGVTYIGDYAFKGCSDLTSVSIPDGVTSIEDSAFYGCSSLMSVSIPEGVTSIERYAFRDCSSLTSVGIPASLTTVRPGAFEDCRSLRTVYYGGSEAKWKIISIASGNYYLTRAKFIYGRNHKCTLTHLPEKAPTCTENGNHEYYYCSICKKAFLDAAGQRETTVKAQTVDALGHAMILHDTQAAACGKPGNAKYYTCRICGNSYKDFQGIQATTPAAETIPALAHLMVKTEAKAPTDTENGNNAYYTCETCHKVFKDEEGKQETTVEDETLPTLEKHELVQVEAKDPTCTETGNRVYYTCDLCDKLYRDETAKFQTTLEAVTIAPLGHAMTLTEAKAATCTEDGNNAYYTCSNCRKVFLDEQGGEGDHRPGGGPARSGPQHHHCEHRCPHLHGEGQPAILYLQDLWQIL